MFSSHINVHQSGLSLCEEHYLAEKRGRKKRGAVRTDITIGDDNHKIRAGSEFMNESIKVCHVEMECLHLRAQFSTGTEEAES